LLKYHCNPTNLNKPYLFNNRFKVKAKRTSYNFITNDINFKKGGKRNNEGLSNEYVSVFGPFFRFVKVVTQRYECDNDGLRGAVRRITCVRKPDIPDLHQELIDNQYNIYNNFFPELKTWLRNFRRSLKNVLPEHVSADELRDKWTEQPHKKKRLREEARRDLFYSGKESHKTRLKRVRYKAKNGETLANDKYLRGVGDLTCPGSTVCGYFMDYVKEAFSVPFILDGGRATFIKKPEKDILEQSFCDLTNPEDVEFRYFSDDSCIGIRCEDGVFTANCDISVCDGSNYRPVFDLLKSGMLVDTRFNRDVKGAFDQCSSPAVVHSYDFSERVVYTPIEPVLYSGSVLTTSVNNMANTLIFIAIMCMLRGKRRYKRDMGALIEEAARRVGFLLKVDQCKTPEDIQFLKHSPCFMEGRMIPVLNLGVLFRGFGTYLGDLPGKGKDWVSKATIFNSEVVRSWVHAGDHVIMDGFRNLIVRKRKDYSKQIKMYTYSHDAQTYPYIPTEILARRYHCSTAALEELSWFIANASPGQHITHPLLDVIVNKDYGYV
jgi:hypothetical protein